jgi:hypothetical protein
MTRNFNVTLAEAMRAVGASPAERLAWLEEFVRRDVSADRGVAARELYAFVLQYAIQVQHYGILQNLDVDEERVEVIQSALKHFLEGVRTPATIPQLVATVSATILSRQPIHGLPLGLSPKFRAPELGNIVQAVGALLLEAGPKLGRCATESCQRLFVGTKVSQKRCRANCGVSDRVRAWRKANSEQVSERRHARYARKVKARLPGAKVSRRKKKSR